MHWFFWKITTHKISKLSGWRIRWEPKTPFLSFRLIHSNWQQSIFIYLIRWKWNFHIGIERSKTHLITYVVCNSRGFQRQTTKFFPNSLQKFVRSTAKKCTSHICEQLKNHSHKFSANRNAVVQTLEADFKGYLPHKVKKKLFALNLV